MKCPICKHQSFKAVDLHSEGFYADILECRVCGTVWSVNHGVVQVIKDVHKDSFLEGSSESVDGDDYILAT